MGPHQEHPNGESLRDTQDTASTVRKNFTTTVQCSLAAAIAVLVFPSSAHAAPGIDPQLVGIWELNVPGQGAWVNKFNANGTYECTNEGPLNLPGHSGTLEAANGQWKTESKVGTPWTDSGPYQFLTPDMVMMTGKLGPGTWVRRATTKPDAEKKDGVPSVQSGVSESASLSKVSPLVAQAREQSKGWQKDAALNAIWVTADPNGFVDLKNLRSLTKQDGHSITLQFHSASAALVQQYVVTDSGKVWSVGITFAPGTGIDPIPEPFLDLDQAIAKAREIGLKPPQADGKSFIDARLNGVQGAYGRPNSAIWKISSIDMSGAYPMPLGETIELTAATGEQTTWQKESGHQELEQLAMELGRGKFLPYDPRRDFAVYRNEADALAAKWNAGLKLSGDKSLKLCDVALEVKDADNLLHVNLHYFRPVVEGWSIFRVEVFGTTEAIVGPGNIVSRGNHVMLIKGEELRDPIPKSSYSPQPAPEKFLASLEAHAHLAKLKPGWQDERHYLRLAFGGSVPERAKDPIKADVMFPALTSDVRSKWLWMTFGAQAVGKHQTSVFTYDLSANVTVAIDAVTGDAINLTNAEPSKTPDDKSEVDPAIVGTWRVSMDQPTDGGAMTLSIAANGEGVLTMEQGKESAQVNATIKAANGKLTIRWPDGVSETSSYEFSDANTLISNDGQDSVKWKRVSDASQKKTPAPSTQVDPALVGLWEGTITDSSGSGKITHSFAANGDHVLTIQVKGAPSMKVSGTLTAAEGKWSLKLPDGTTEKGNYGLVDANTMNWVEGANPPMLLKRMPASTK